MIAEGDAEIEFNSIPWLSDQETAMDLLKDYLYPFFSVSYLGGEEGLFLRHDDELLARPVKAKEYSDVSTCLIINSIKKNIAGYKVEKIKLYFSNNGLATQLLCVQIDLAGSQYDDLQSKLSKVYGNGETRISEEGLETALWNGTNDSCVLLYSVDGGESADLIYGRLDAEKILNECALSLIDVDPNDLSGL